MDRVTCHECNMSLPSGDNILMHYMRVHSREVLAATATIEQMESYDELLDKLANAVSDREYIIIVQAINSLSDSIIRYARLEGGNPS